MTSRQPAVWLRLWHRFAPAERAGFIDGARFFAPSLPAVFSWGLVTGVAMSKSVMTVPEAIGMSLLVYAGSAQLAVLPLFAAGLPLWTIWLTAAVVNLRFVIFSAGMQPHFSYLPLWRRTILGSFNGDLHFVYFLQKYSTPGYEPGKEGYFWGMALTNFCMWQVSSIIGIVLASLFPDSWGLGLAGTMALIPVMIATINSRSTLLAVVVSAVLALLCFDLPYRLSLVVAVVGAIAAGMASDDLAARAALRGIRRRKTKATEVTNACASDAQPGDRA
ncbi:AzlC family ABC transporter permease [Cupriavidus lacunae]|uniref:Branched-chain amino acid ABC transporter permease n=1 Tax=Cupriavidus lacunae TaxID=2666307 RepID=A0A370NPJ6_9BURK|nr:AzlC family ABC transporter permease [Cupriavidus lacunae]RDK07542.1 branched-chain amino acid ABC transporter permease [Cupriavidus lacunae]